MNPYIPQAYELARYIRQHGHMPVAMPPSKPPRPPRKNYRKFDRPDLVLTDRAIQYLKDNPEAGDKKGEDDGTQTA